MEVSVRSDAVSSAGRALHDIGLGAMIGGNLFGRLGMHPALRRVTEPTERGAVVNAAWRRYGTINGLSLAAVIAGWAGARAGEARPKMLSDRERKLAVAKDAAVGAVAVTGVAAAAQGMRFASMEPDGAVALADGSEPAPETPEREARAKRVLNVLGGLNLASALALAGVNATLGQANFRRPPARRLLRRRY
jgi:hypothetical protein